MSGSSSTTSARRMLSSYHMRIVVTGGTGFIGREIVDRLLEAGGDELVVTSRDPGRSDPWGGRVQAGPGLRRRSDVARQGLCARRCRGPGDSVSEPPVENAAKGRTYRGSRRQGHRGRGARRQDDGRAPLRVSLRGGGGPRTTGALVSRQGSGGGGDPRESGLESGFLRPSWIYGPSRPQHEPLRLLLPLPARGSGDRRWHHAGPPDLREGRGALRGRGRAA